MKRVKHGQLLTGVIDEDSFMKRVKHDKLWSLMCPNDCRTLSDVYGNEFNFLYEQYETDHRYIKQVNAREFAAIVIVSADV